MPQDHTPETLVANGPSDWAKKVAAAIAKAYANGGKRVHWNSYWAGRHGWFCLAIPTFGLAYDGNKNPRFRGWLSISWLFWEVEVGLGKRSVLPGLDDHAAWERLNEEQFDADIANERA